jgi:hypothetical protein
MCGIQVADPVRTSAGALRGQHVDLTEWCACPASPCRARYVFLRVYAQCALRSQGSAVACRIPLHELRVRVVKKNFASQNKKNTTKINTLHYGQLEVGDCGCCRWLTEAAASITSRRVHGSVLNALCLPQLPLIFARVFRPKPIDLPCPPQ